MSLFWGNKKVSMLVGDKKRVYIDTELNTESTNPVVNKAIATSIASLIAENEDLKNQINNINQELSTLTTSLASSFSDKDQEIETLTLALENSNSEIATLKEQVQTLTNSLNSIRNEFDGHVTYLGSYQSDVANRFSSIDSRLEALESNESYNEGILDDEYTNLEDLFG